jgi:hypothetical protein
MELFVQFVNNTRKRKTLLVGMRTESKLSKLQKSILAKLESAPQKTLPVSYLLGESENPRARAADVSRSITRLVARGLVCRVRLVANDREFAGVELTPC